MTFDLMDPLPVFAEGLEVKFLFRATVGCVLADCSSTTFALSLVLDEDRELDGDETSLSATIAAADGGAGFNTPLTG